MQEQRNVRPAGVAGAFYPADPGTLSGDVDRMLDAAGDPTDGSVRVLLAPHAGYVYSGSVAAHSYRQLSPAPPASVIMIGPSHFEPFRFTSLYGGGYETPLGVVEVNTGIANELADSAEGIRFDDAGHVQPRLPNKEHGLEVQLPFLQRVAPQASFVPVVMGDQSWERCVELGKALAPLLKRDDVVVVVSSDLSHFYNYDAAQTKDALFCELVAALDAEALRDAIAAGRCEACGAGPMLAAMLALEGIDAQCQVLQRINSGDVTGDHGSVVGYAAAAVTIAGSPW